MNSFKAVYGALTYEAQRQRELAGRGEHINMETRGWQDNKEITVSQRSKEYAHDYRYFPEPDLPPVLINREQVEEIRAKLPELPEARRDRFMSRFGLPLYDANLLTESKSMADYFDSCLQTGIEVGAKTVSNWLLGEFSRLLNVTGTEIGHSRVISGQLCHLLDLVQKGGISGTSAKAVLEEMFNTGKPADDIIKEKGLSQITDTREIEEAVRQVIASNAQAVSDYRSGKIQALKFLVGQVMKATRGRVNAALAQELLVKRFEETQNADLS
jgi:aspartyl-tRNA(Asn)/glutamyl-tRNA(Gln) amidotransferase subunit B